MKFNPFILTGYESPKFFCDRDYEKERIIDAVLNQRNITLISSRRMGKTGLIFHVFNDYISNKDIIPIYFDILGTTNLKEFIEAFGNAITNSLGKTESGFKKIIKQLHHLRPELSFDALNGEPRVSFDIRNEREILSSLQSIFQLIESKGKYFVIAIDEFQQISEYPEKNTEAILRSHIQHIRNAGFVFSGSKKHLLSDMFSQPSRPFFSSTDMMFLKPIQKEKYFGFIRDHFSSANKEISDEALESIAHLTGLHTFYTQFLCNRLYASFRKVNREKTEQILSLILKENEAIYANYLNLLTNTQYRTLRAIAREGVVRYPNSKEFLKKYDLGAASSVSQAINSLQDKEFILKEKNNISVQDKFFREWIKMKTI